MDEIYTFSRSSDHVDEWKSTFLLRFRLMLGEDVRAFRSKSKMEKSSKRISTVQFLQWLTRSGIFAQDFRHWRNFLLYIRAIQGHTGGILTAPELMGHAAFPYKIERIPVSSRMLFLMSLQSSHQDSSLEDEKAKKEDRLSSSHLSTRSGTIHTKQDPAMTHQNQEKFTITVSGKLVRTPSVGSIQPAHRTKDCKFWQTRSNAVIVFNSVPTDCIYKVISQKGERTLFQRLSTPRPAPKIVLKSARQPQQQQDTSESSASGTRKLERRDESTVETESEFKVDLRIEGIAQDVILKDDERMGKIQEVVENEERLMHEIYSGRSEKTQKTPWYPARNPVASSMKLATSSCTNKDRWPSSIIHAGNTCWKV